MIQIDMLLQQTAIRSCEQDVFTAACQRWAVRHQAQLRLAELIGWQGERVIEARFTGRGIARQAMWLPGKVGISYLGGTTAGWLFHLGLLGHLAADRLPDAPVQLELLPAGPEDACWALTHGGSAIGEADRAALLTEVLGIEVIVAPRRLPLLPGDVFVLAHRDPRQPTGFRFLRGHLVS